MSKLCPGEYPTTIDILITNLTDDRNFTNIMLMEGSQDNIFTTVDTITLQSDMKYTIQVSFNNLDGDFNITSNENFSKWIVIIIVYLYTKNIIIVIIVLYIGLCSMMHEHVVYNIDTLL